MLTKQSLAGVGLDLTTHASTVLVLGIIQVGRLEAGFGVACAVRRWHMCHHGLHSRVAHVLPPFRDLKSYTGQMGARHAPNACGMRDTDPRKRKHFVLKIPMRPRMDAAD